MNLRTYLLHPRCFLLAAIAALATAAAASPQGPAAAVTAAAGVPKSLHISILEGEGALNDLRARTAREPIVEVQDENHKPVAGATVLFFINSGHGGVLNATFSGAQSVSVTTDAEGRAVGRGFQLNHVSGKFRITVRAHKGALEAETVIVETNMLVLSHDVFVNHFSQLVANKPLFYSLLGAAAAGVAVGVVLATESSSTVSVTAGTGTVGAPTTSVGIRFEIGRHQR